MAVGVDALAVAAAFVVALHLVFLSFSDFVWVSPVLLEQAGLPLWEYSMVLSVPG